jgi:coproporphyrinogen III oxidase-like Fe-S oxidoreductase
MLERRSLKIRRELTAWKDEVGSGRLPVFRGYVQTRDDTIRGAVIEECLCNGRVSKDDIEFRFGIAFDAYLRLNSCGFTSWNRMDRWKGRRRGRFASLQPAASSCGRLQGSSMRFSPQ